MSVANDAAESTAACSTTKRIATAFILLVKHKKAQSDFWSCPWLPVKSPAFAANALQSDSRRNPIRLRVILTATAVQNARRVVERNVLETPELFLHGEKRCTTRVVNLPHSTASQQTRSTFVSSVSLPTEEVVSLSEIEGRTWRASGFIAARFFRRVSTDWIAAKCNQRRDSGPHKNARDCEADN